ncbi:DNA repair protein RecO [Parasporobacterium paucivorans]|uniref:DNA repair protein RecO n=1 Tax=Parasporobacterium paucivorans DSM 15970 TaxID=1122934 RepID=A0A1M6FKX3_9FIRM|nr:DNA repair protein RecO [Parasporobacterium paucivorans]SHI98335.1 DNA replication and repair protein RecO [Parasporobacterium paucivorans DSM 15970]
MTGQVILTGMVLSAMPVGEYDRRLVILTGERGKISAFAKGARRPNSTFMAGSRPFCMGEFTLYCGKSSYNIVGMDMKNYFSEIATNLNWVCQGTYFLEMCDYFGRENEDSREMINLLYYSLKAMTTASIEDSLIRRIFEVRLMAVNGLYPDLRPERIQNMNPSTVYAMEYIISSSVEKLYTFRVTGPVLSELSGIADKLCREHVDKKIKSLEILEKL